MKKFTFWAVFISLLLTVGIFYNLSSFTFSILDKDNSTEASDRTSNSDGSSGNENNETEKASDNSPNDDTVFFMDNTEFDLSRSTHEDAINYQEGKEPEAKEIILYLHDVMNDITGYGHVESLRFDALRDNAYHDNSRFKEGIKKLQEELLDDSRALHDIRNLENFYQLGSSHHSEDRMALRYAHRIIHDLDVYVNGARSNDDRDTWGVTEAFGNDDTITQLYDYLRNSME